MDWQAEGHGRGERGVARDHQGRVGRVVEQPAQARRLAEPPREPPIGEVARARRDEERERFRFYCQHYDVPEED